MQSNDGRQCIGGPVAPHSTRPSPPPAAGSVSTVSWRWRSYEPGLGYYSRGRRPVRRLPESGSDFVTAPELSPLFGRRWRARWRRRSTRHRQRRGGLGVRRRLGRAGRAVARRWRRSARARYTIVDLSGSCARASGERLARPSATGCWVDALPMDARASSSATRCSTRCRCSCCTSTAAALARARRGARSGALGLGRTAPACARRWGDPGLRARHRDRDPPAGRAFVATLADGSSAARAFFIDYGFPEAEYYHPQRRGGTLMCHRAHRSDDDPLADPARRTSPPRRFHRHRAGRRRTPAGRDRLHHAGALPDELRHPELLQGADLRTIANTQKLLTEHEMGELFKVIGFGQRHRHRRRSASAQGDRTHTPE